VVRYFFNYSDNPASIPYTSATGVELLSGSDVQPGQTCPIDPWGVLIIVEK
jgi:beta-galactosidase